MFQFPTFALTLSVTGLQPDGLPHSEISGSIPVCSSPELVAAYHVLLRLQKPRHPPFALVTFSLWVSLLWITRTFVLFLHLFSFTRCLEIAVHNNTIDSLSFLLVTDFLISSSNFTSLSFLKLVNELFFFIFLPIAASDCESSVGHYLKVTPSFLARPPCTEPK